MAIDPHYIPAFSIEDVLLDKDTGAPLAGGIVTFYEDNQRTILKPVYQITGTSPNYMYTQLPNPMTLSAIGTFEDSLDNPTVPYFFPFDGADDPDYYYLTVYSAGGVFQFDRQAVPYIPEELNPASSTISFTNALTNPQFAQVLFDTTTSTYTYTVSGASLLDIPLAPGWDLIVSGTGTVTVFQDTPAGTINILTNPGTLLNIDSGSGITFLRLRQTLVGSPILFGSENVTGFFVAKTFAGTSTTVTMYYSQSNGTVVNVPVVSAVLPGDGSYIENMGTVLIPASTSPDSFPNGYVYIDIDIPPSTNIEITSIQIVPTGTTSVADVPYDETSNDRQIVNEFWYYQPQINFKPIPSLLTAWDFPLNPAQPLGASFTITTTPKYGWDQTVVASVVGNIAATANAVTDGFQTTTANANEAYYMIQYLSGSQAMKILNTTLSVNVNAFITQAGGAVTVKVYLYRGSSAASFPTLPTTIGTLAADGTFTLTAANWTLIPRSNLGQAHGVLSVVNTADYSTLNDVVDLAFSGWEITDGTQLSDTNKFAIVVTYSCPTTATVITTNSISVVPGDIPTRPAPQSLDEVLRECQYYFQKSSAPGFLPANNQTLASGPTYAIQYVAAGAVNVIPIRFAVPTRVIPVYPPLYYNPTSGTAGQILNVTTGASYSSTSTISSASLSQNGFVAQGTADGGSSAGNLIALNWSVDARLGII